VTGQGNLQVGHVAISVTAGCKLAGGVEQVERGLPFLAKKRLEGGDSGVRRQQPVSAVYDAPPDP